MRQFFKYVFSSCLGTILALGLIVLVLFLVGISSAPKNTIPNDAVLHLKLNTFLPELTNNVEQDPFAFEQPDMVGLNDLTALLRQAQDDKNIKGILLQTEEAALNTSTALYVSELLREFKASGKYLGAYGNYFSQTGYLLASNADEITLNPNGFLDLKGYGMVIPYFKDFSEKTNIDFDVYFAGKYKSAIEPFYRSESSENNRYQTHEYLSDFQDVVSATIATNRGMTAPEVENIMINALATHAEACQDLNLVDEISYWEEFEESLEEKLDVSKVKYVELYDYWKATKIDKGDGSDRIAIVYAEGEIAHSGKTKGAVSMERYIKALDRIKKNDKVKAVVLRVNSPGGSAFTSDLFWKKIEDIKKAGKVVVASYGDYAASGGYYISCGADKIVSEPTTLTGSIGVFSMIPDMHEFFDEKLGIDWDTIGTGKHTFLYSTMTTRSEADNRKLMNDTERIYDQFLTRVAEGRGMTKEAVNEIAQGRVWSGMDALEVGLVDEIGTIQDAIEIAAAEAGTDSYKLLQYPVIKKTFYEELLSSMATEDLAKAVGLRGPGYEAQQKTAQVINEFVKHVDNATKTPQARLPFMLME